MKKYVSEKEIPYTGAELSSHFALRTFGIQGDSIVAFIGPCDVKTRHLVDLIDARENASIFSTRMLHFIIEMFELNLEKAILLQRLLVSIVAEHINRQRKGHELVRINDDIFLGEKKLSVSIATLSPVSSLIHVGLNVSSRDTPVETVGLEELGIDARELADQISDAFVKEVESIAAARCKVRGVL
jgi:hypothetical protein